MGTHDWYLMRLSRAQIDPASEMLVRSFFNDPKLAYILPDDEERREKAKSLNRSDG